jgi:cell pole-organizing protein PopZ
MSQTGGADPSMEDILASIRRILSEDDTVVSKAAQPAPAPAPSENLLVLDSSMLVREPQHTPPFAAQTPPADAGAIARPAMEPAKPASPSPSSLPMMHFTAPAPAPVAVPEVAPAVVAPAPVAMEPAAEPVLQAVPETGLVAPEAVAAASTSLGELVRTLTAERQTPVYRGGPTLEDMVRDEMRPILKQWLDTNLPALVERLVRAEIERVVGRAVS